MDIITTKHYGTRLDVIMDGRYIFKDAWHGIVAVAKPIHNDSYDVVGYNVEHTLAIEQNTIKRVIRKHWEGFPISDRAKGLEFKFDTKNHVGSLPYGIRIELFN